MEMLGSVRVICETQNVGVMQCIRCEIVSEMFVKVTLNRTIKTVYIGLNLEISNSL